ncbi:TPA: PerC family transcriptional regulator [Salmonella enterica subsp. enterica serovar Bovismorbificans]
MPEKKRKTPKLPDDAIARELEHRKLWRRAACRWRYVLVITEYTAHCGTDCTAYSMVSAAGSTKASGDIGIVGE